MYLDSFWLFYLSRCINQCHCINSLQKNKCHCIKMCSIFNGWTTLSARLFPLFQLKKRVLKKANVQWLRPRRNFFILGLWREHAGWERSSELHFGKSPCAFIYIRWTHRTITKLPFDKSEDKLHTIPYSSHLSALPSALSITNFQIQTQKNL